MVLEIQNVSEVPTLPIPLVERSEGEIAQTIRRRVEAMKDVRGCRQLSVRIAGKRLDVDMLILLDANLRWENAHKIALEVEREVMNEFPRARVTIHTEPVGNSRESVWKLVKELAEGVPGSRGVHNIHVQKIDGKLCIDLHLEVSANMNVKQAHDTADLVERKIKAANPKISEVTVHIELASERISRELARVETELESYVEHVAKQLPEIRDVHGISIRRFGDTLHLVLHCRFDPNLNIKKAHEVSSKLEGTIRTAYPGITRIDIHEEPA